MKSSRLLTAKRAESIAGKVFFEDDCAFGVPFTSRALLTAQIEAARTQC